MVTRIVNIPICTKWFRILKFKGDLAKVLPNMVKHKDK